MIRAIYLVLLNCEQMADDDSVTVGTASNILVPFKNSSALAVYTPRKVLPFFSRFSSVWRVPWERRRFVPVPDPETGWK